MVPRDLISYVTFRVAKISDQKIYKLITEFFFYKVFPIIRTSINLLFL